MMHMKNNMTFTQMTYKKKDNRPPFENLDATNLQTLYSIPTPCYVLDETQLKKNGKLLKQLQETTGCKILLAQKAFSNYNLYPSIAPYLAGTEASGLFEARLGKEQMPDKECHVFSAAYKKEEFEEVLQYADHIVFNSPSQLKKFGKKAKEAYKSIGLRINPEYSTQEGHDIYDPCAPGSRLGTTKKQWDILMTSELLSLLDGLHFHTLCEQNSDSLVKTLQVVEAKWGNILHRMKWINLGGGHHITNPTYDCELLKDTLIRLSNTYDIQVYLEPGEAVALNSGYLITSILDLLENEPFHIAITDSSAACHMPDVLEMPYRPPLFHEGSQKDAIISYRLSGPTCLSGDIIGDYHFPTYLSENDHLIFGDMAIYTTCKNNTFNGMPLPSIYVLKTDGTISLLASFSYEDFKKRLGT